MLKKATAKVLALFLVTMMIIGMLPMSVFAGSVSKYPDFLAKLKQLEVYADEYASESGKDPGELVLNFIRTGVERYQDDNWETLAGVEITAFTNYVEQQDAINGTAAMDLRDIVIRDFILPNGNQADFGHMFGTMNISYVNTAVQTDDLSGWAGDLCDLLYYSAERANVPAGTIDQMAAYILENCFGVDASDAFGWDDFYGDMDAYYIVNEYQDGNGSLSQLMESYFTADLDDVDRSVYFLNRRFPGVTTRDEVRTAMYNAYRTNVGIQVLEAGRNLSDCNTLRQACCYAMADYMFNQAEGKLNADAGDEGEGEDKPDNGYFSVFSTTSSVLAPGITQDINYAMSADGKQMVYYVATVDVNRDDVTILANYKDNDPSKGWGMQRVEDQVAALVKNHKNEENFTPVVATNGDGFNTATGEPGGLLVMGGKVWKPIDGDGFFGILKDGSAIIGTKADYEALSDEVVEGIGAFGSGKFLVKDGKIADGAKADNRAGRTAIGIKADGSVVMMVLDGRQQPFSCGGNLREVAQIMLEAGCEIAVNLDGGGSTTYMSKPEGSDQIKVVNRPSDGYARSVAATLVAVSTAKSSEELDRAIIESDYDYLTKGTSLQLSAVGVNNIGSSAEIPADAYWMVSDESVGTVSEDGVFTANPCDCEEGYCENCIAAPENNADVDVYLMVGDQAVGSKKLHVVVPEKLEFTKKNMDVLYDVKTEMPLVAYYEGNPVAMNETDFFMASLEYDEETVVTEGAFVTIPLEAGIRTATMAAILMRNESEEAYCEMPIYIFRDDETSFDFDNATAGNRTLAWLREVENTSTNDNFIYTVTDPEEGVALKYSFGLDLNAIELPERFADIVYMLPNSDNQGDSAFGYMLALAERISVKSEVCITAQFDKDLDVDVSGLTIACDYFALTSAKVDENNQLTMIFNWIDRTEPIDPATANPFCIMTGIKATPKDGSWDGNEMVITNTGNVSYSVYLRASSLYSFALKSENQQKYGLLPYVADDTGWEGGTETGAYYSSLYTDFEDGFIINNAVRQGWYKEDGNYKYYVNHKPVTGVQYIPSREDAAINLFYEFDENGICKGKLNGAVHYNGGLYYAMGGEMTTGWVAAYDAEGNEVDYYFDPSTGKAVNGKQKIGGYNYEFTDYVLTRGEMVTDATGTRYRWAGKWIHGKWFQIDGNWYCTKRYIYYVQTGFVSVQDRITTEWKWHLFDDKGVFQENFNGIYHYEGEIYYIKDGKRDSAVGLVYEDGHYYYIDPSNAKAYKNRTAWINKTNGLVPAGRYTFDANGWMVNPPVEEPDVPNPPVNPEPEQPKPEEPKPEVPVDPSKNGIYTEDGALYYYVDGVRQANIGVVKLTDNQNVDFYIYVRSNGQLAVGTYWITTTNDLLEKGKYTFNDEGKYYPPVEEPEQPDVPAVKNGVLTDEDGVIRYYINGVRQANTGVVELVDENGLVYYIYVRSNGALATGVYWPTQRNDLLPRGGYDWGTDGKYYPPSVEEPDVPNPPVDPEPEEPKPEEPKPEEPKPEVKNGIYNEDGVYRYYVDGVRQANTGVVKLTDENGQVYYIYVRSNGQLATGKYWPTQRNDLLPRGEYDWGTDGRYYPAQ